jgi:hypothetical protein
MRLLPFVLIGLLALIHSAQAAKTTVVVTVPDNPVISTTVACPAQASYPPPANATGALICTIAVQPPNWQGKLTLSGANADKFTINGLGVYVGPAALPAGSSSTFDVNSDP